MLNQSDTIKGNKQDLLFLTWKKKSKLINAVMTTITGISVWKHVLENCTRDNRVDCHRTSDPIVIVSGKSNEMNV